MSYTGKESVYASTLFMKEERTVCVCTQMKSACVCAVCGGILYLRREEGEFVCLYLTLLKIPCVSVCVCVLDMHEPTINMCDSVFNHPFACY